MSGINNERNPHVASIYLGSQASGASVVVPGLYFRKRSRIKQVNIVDQAGVTLLSTDYFAFTLQDNGSTPVAYASGNTSATTLVANTPSALTLQAGGGSGLAGIGGRREGGAAQHENCWHL